jgi:hypothetical protein
MSYQKYRIYCITEGVFHTVWSLNPPTQCPVDTGHSVNLDSVTEVGASETVIRTATPTNVNDWSTVFQTINSARRPTEFIKCIYAVEDGTGSIRLYDVSTPSVLSQVLSLTSTTGPTILNMPAMTGSIETDTIIELQIKKDGGAGDMVLETIFLYTS